MNRPAIRHARQFVLSATGRLAASYLLLIMAMSLGYSLVLYSTSASQLRRQLPPPSMYYDRNDDFKIDDGGASPKVKDFLNRRIEEGRQALIGRLVILNLLTLVVGSGLSYYLARRTLKPIEDNMEAQVQFVSDASHELRTPLTTIRTANEVALRNSNLTLSQSKNVLQQNIEETIKLQALTDALLALATQEANAGSPEVVSVQDIANEAMNRVVRQAQSKAVTVDDQVPDIKVLANRQAMAQAVVILLDNAIKYSPKKSTVTLQAIKKSKYIVLQVADNGPGIPADDMERIFDRFYRVDQSRSGAHVGGHGIGLALAKKIVEQQGGVIGVRSVVGKGSVFSITLPLA